MPHARWLAQAEWLAMTIINDQFDNQEFGKQSCIAMKGNLTKKTCHVRYKHHFANNYKHKGEFKTAINEH